MKSQIDYLEHKRMTEQEMAEGRMIIDMILTDSLPAQPGDLIHALLQRVGIFETVPPSVRLHPRLPYFLGDEAFGVYPAMVMPLRTGSGEFVGVNTTYLAEGGLAPVVAPNQLNLLVEFPGAFFALDGDIGPVVAVAAGLGSALSARALMPLQASMCVVGSREDLADFDWPQDTRELIVLCDDSNRDQAQTLIDRAAQAGLTVRAYMPPTQGARWLDEYLFKGAIPADEIAAAKQSGSPTH